ncbi:MAG: nitrilase-related carbon-nitrogen hydrolase, partial [Alphaproteobacteria bacterium]
MTERLTIALAQCNPVVGDVAGNIERIRAIRDACSGVDLIVFSELVVSGYPPEDLVLKPFFQDKVEAAVAELAKETGAGNPALLVTAPWRENGKVYNAVILLDGGTIAAKRFKHDLPNYGVFDEKRVFASGPMPGPINFRDV